MSQSDIREYLDKPSPAASDIDAQLEAEEKVAATADKTATKVASDKELAEHRADDTLATVKTLSQLAADPAMAPLPMDKMLSEQSPSTPTEETCRVGRGTSRVKDGQTVADGNPRLWLAVGQFVGGHPAFSRLDWLRWPPPPHRRC